MQLLLKKFINRETISYLFFGILTTVVNYAVYELCKCSGLHYTLSTALAWAAAVAFAFVTNKLFVFESKSWESSLVFREVSKFVTCRLVSGFFDLLYMILVVELFSMNDSLAKLTANIFVVMINYIFSKLIIFKKVKQ